MPSIKTAAKDKSQPQAEKFRAMAKELDADGDEKGLDSVLKKIAASQKDIRGPSKD